MIAVFEPRSWSSRLAVFQDDYANAFAAADYVVIAAVFDSQKVTEKGRALDTRALIDAISQQGKPALALPDADQIVTHLVPELRSGRRGSDYVQRRLRWNSREDPQRTPLRTELVLLAHTL